MSDPSDSDEDYSESSPEYSEDDSSDSAQGSDDDQDASTHQGHYDHPNPNQQPTQQLDEQYPDSDEETNWYRQRNPSGDENIGHSGDDPVLETMVNTVEQSIEDSRLSAHQVPYAQQAQGSYLAAGRTPVTENFNSPGFTSWDARSSQSQPYVPSQTAGTWAHDRGLQPLPGSMQNPFGSVEQPVTGFERATGIESALSLAQEWEVRVRVAQGAHFDEIVRYARGFAPSVQRFIASNSLMWTPEQDRELRKSMRNRDTINVMQERLSHVEGPFRSDDEIQARVQHLADWGQYAQPAELAATPQPDPQQFPAVCQPGEVMPPQARHGAKTNPAPRIRWTADDNAKFKAFFEKHGDKWREDVQEVFPNRSRGALHAKWRHLHYLQPQQPARPKLSSADLFFIKNENAKGFSIAQIALKQYPGYGDWKILQDLRLSGWAPWTRGEDQEVLKLQQGEGDEWAQITNVPAGVSRSRQEVKIRYELLTGVLIDAPERRAAPARYRWEPADDEELELKLAQGMTTVDVAKGGFRGLQKESIRDHAVIKGYFWTKQDDNKLRGMNLEPDALFDWNSIGRQYVPQRKGHLVKLRWEFLYGINEDGKGAAAVPWTQREFEDIKLWLARGYTHAMIVAKCYPRRTVKGMQTAMSRGANYKSWTGVQDNDLLVLQMNNEGNLAEIKRKLSGPERNEGEILQRLWLLTERRNHKGHKRLHGSSMDDDYVRLQLARGISYAEMAREMFRGMGQPTLERFARTIGATWSEEDDQKLRDKVLEYEDYGLEVDWEFIGQEYDPLRPADIVEIRWKYLRGTL